jgi:hypothetical protein
MNQNKFIFVLCTDYLYTNRENWKLQTSSMFTKLIEHYSKLKTIDKFQKCTKIKNHD